MLIEIGPAIELGSVLPGLIENRSQPAVTTGKHAFNNRQAGIVVVKRNRSICDVLLEQTLTTFKLRNRQLPKPLERRIWFRHEAGHGYRNLNPTTPLNLCIEVDDLLSQFCNTDDILVSLGRQSHHKIELDLFPALAERGATGTHEVLLRNALIDNIAQPLRTSLRRKRQARLADLLHLMRQINRETVDTQRRQREAYFLIPEIRHQVIDQPPQTGIIR